MPYSLDNILTMLENDGRGITIVQSTFIKMNHNATFIHPTYGEWQSTPKKVVIQKTTHPTESNLNRSLSNKKAREGDEVLEKTKKTNLSRYGVEYAFTSEEVKAKRQQTNLDRYGVKESLSSSSIREKGKATKLERYGDENYANHEAAEKTLIERYGENNPQKVLQIREKSIRTKEGRGLITRPRGVSWEELAKELNVPRTSMQSFIKANNATIEDYLNAREQGYSDIEHTFSNHMSVSKYVGLVLKYRPDFHIGNAYVNIDGLYWHSQKVEDRDKDYHFKLRQAFENDGKRIFQFRADDVKYRMPIVESMINNFNGNSKEKLFARKCEVVIVDPKEARGFLTTNHMMGSSNSKFIGLYSNGELVSLMGYKNHNGVVDIDRFATKLNTNVVGGLSRLLSAVKKKTSPVLIKYWVDLRYGNGASIEKCGFKFARDVQSWQWTDFTNTFNRLKCKATATKSQHEVAAESGLWQIYDAGQRLFVWTTS